MILTCGDPRVDPAHVLGLELGEAVVIRNNGGRVTRAVVEEIAALAFMVAKIDGDSPGPFEIIIMQHTQCGAERFANPELQQTMLDRIGIDVAPHAIKDHEQSLLEDIERLRSAPEVPAYVVVSGLLYDVKDGTIREVVTPTALSSDKHEA